MANITENGPSNHNREGDRVWERPWTLEEMQKSSTNWSLAADSGLFLFLRDFSQRMLSKTHEIEKQLDGLIQETKATDSQLHTVFNDFLMLSNTQFIENRVYDEEVEDPAPKPEAAERPMEQEKTREQKEAELIPKIQKAVNYGLKVLETAFEQLDIKAGNSESEDEEVAEKDLYADRPLPYLIGSRAFMDQDDIGLGDLSSDDMSIGSDRESIIEGETDEGDETDPDEYSDHDQEPHGILKKKPSIVGDEASEENKEDDNNSDIFGGSNEDEEDLQKESGLPSFADELAARIKGEMLNSQEAERTSLSSGVSSIKKKSKSKTELQPQIEEDEMFRPSEMENEEFSPFGAKSGLFSGGKGLFDDEDEGDLFSEAPKQKPAEKDTTATQAREPLESKKIPSGAVSIFPENTLFTNNPVTASVQEAPKVGGLFDDDEDEDDFFRGKALNKSTTGQDKKMPKSTIDLFGEADLKEDEGATISRRKTSATLPQQDKRTEGEEETRPPEKKLPAGAISMFGPGTKNILDGLKKLPPSTGEKSDEGKLPPEEVKSSPVLGAAEKTQSRGLFSDDEDSHIFQSEATSKSKPTARNKPSKTLSLFDDEEEEEEDLFSSTPKSKMAQVKKTSLHSRKPEVSSLFSDDEDQWISSKPSKESSGAMKQSFSAPSRLPAVKAAAKEGLFDGKHEEDEDLFTATNQLSKNSSKRVSLLFEDEDDEADKEPLFAVEVKDKMAEEKKAVDSKVSFEESAEAKKKPVGAVSLFGGIDVLEDNQDTRKNPIKKEVQTADGKLLKEDPPSKEIKGKAALSLFDQDDVDDDNGSHLKSTNVFQDEELLFSQTQQRDNDPDVDLFASSPKPSMPSQNSAKAIAPTLFGDDDEEQDDLFRPAQPKAPPASLALNAASLLPGAVPRIPGAISVMPGLVAVARPLSVSDGKPDLLMPSESGVSFDSPAQGRTKGSVRRRPQTRAARHLAAQQSEEVVEQTIPADPPATTASLPSFNPVSERASPLTVPTSSSGLTNNPAEVVRPKRFLASGDDLFDSDDLFATSPVSSAKRHQKVSKIETVMPSKTEPASSLFSNCEDDLFGADEVKESTKAPKRSKEVPMDASLFDDGVDIFADLSGTTKAKERNAKKKVETKSIFDDD
ncbi:hypothetical protein DNTS_014686, partial [Danionella cerebrum]